MVGSGCSLGVRIWILTHGHLIFIHKTEASLSVNGGSPVNTQPKLWFQPWCLTGGEKWISQPSTAGPKIRTSDPEAFRQQINCHGLATQRMSGVGWLSQPLQKASSCWGGRCTVQSDCLVQLAHLSKRVSTTQTQQKNGLQKLVTIRCLYIVVILLSNQYAKLK